MTQVSTELKTHVLVFKDGSVKFINKVENEFIERDKAAGCQGSYISGGFIDFKMIGKHLDAWEYYRQYPQNRPDPYPKFDSSKYAWKAPDDTNRAIRELTRGLERYIASTPDNPIVDGEGRRTWYQGTRGPKEILARMRQRLEEAESGRAAEEVSIGGMVTGFMGQTSKA
jgi:hypothetical protein